MGIVLGSPGLKLRITIVLGLTGAIAVAWMCLGGAVFPLGQRTE